jgi:hypothetical protein
MFHDFFFVSSNFHTPHGQRFSLLISIFYFSFRSAFVFTSVSLPRISKQMLLDAKEVGG